MLSKCWGTLLNICNFKNKRAEHFFTSFIPAFRGFPLILNSSFHYLFLNALKFSYDDQEKNNVK